jgi:ubiquinol-cytochrome c reductase cytochrome b subunit
MEAMRSRLMAWLDERLGLSVLRRFVLDVPLAGGPRWGYVFGSVMLWLFAIEIATGLALMTVYAPSSHTAWASVLYIQQHFHWGALVRGLHHWTANAFLVVVGLHLMQVLLSGAYKRPREGNWWLGLLLLAVVFGFAHTGALLPWDQKAYWTTRVESGIAGTVPVVGEAVQRMLQGGRELGTLTLTRLYAAHVGLLPLLTLVLVGAHVALVRRHGLTPPPSVPDTPPDAGKTLDAPARVWPSQTARDALATLAIVALVLYAARRWGAPLDAPADPQGEYPARPEWFLLWLYKLRKMFEGKREIIATVVLPGLATAFLFAVPFLDRSATRALRARLPVVAATLGLVVAVGGLTLAQVRADRRDPAYQRARALADRRAIRAHELAARGIPPEGALEMVRNDPRVRPGELFQEHCGSCHAGPEVPGRDAQGRRTNARGPTLEGFGSRQWARSLLNDPDAPALFGRTNIHDMPSQARRLGEEGMRAVVEYLYAQTVEPGDPPADATLARRGDEIYHQRCTQCHQGEGDQSETPPEECDAPNLTGWGSRAWIRDQILRPSAPDHYGARDEMPDFADRVQGRDLEWLVDYVRQLRARPAPVVPPPPPRAPPPEPAQRAPPA